MTLEADGDVLGDREGREDAGVLERASEADGGPAVGPPPGDVDTLQEDATAVEREQAGDEVEDRGLASAVGADETQDRVGLEREGDVVDRDDAAEPLGEPTHLEHRLALAVAARLLLASRHREGLDLAGSRPAGDRGRALEEHRAEDVAALEELLGGPREADLALLHEVGPLRDRQGHVHRLLDEDDSGALVVDRSHDPEELLDDRGREAE